MYKVPTATGHGRELQAHPLVFGATRLSKCKRIVYKCKWKLLIREFKWKVLIREFE